MGIVDYDTLLFAFEKAGSVEGVAKLLDASVLATNTALMYEGLVCRTDESVSVFRDSFTQVFTHDMDASGIRYACGKSIRDVACDFVLPDLSLGVDLACVSDRMASGVLQQRALEAREQGVAKVFVSDIDWCDDRFREIFFRQLFERCDKRRVIGARSCDVSKVEFGVAAKFLDTYHFQGSMRSLGLCLGLYCDDVLVSLLCFGRSRFKSGAWEILRYCIHPRYAVSGGFARLLRHACDMVASSGDLVITYMDLSKRFRADSVYARNGFAEDLVTVPDYVWSTLDGNISLSRYQTTKRHLVEIGYPSDMSEDEIMMSMGMIKFFGLGSVRYSMVVR